MIADESVVTRLHHDPELINRWTLERVTDLWRIGAPLDVFLKTDLPRLDRRHYPLIIELDQDHACTIADWRQKARDAGVHVYTDAGDQVLAERELLAVHAANAGERTIALPRRCAVADAFDGAVLGTDVDRFRVSLRAGETAVWRLRG